MKRLIYLILIFLSCFYPSKAQKVSISVSPEKIYLHTDRDLYVAGEYLFYKLYIRGNPGQKSKYAYLIIRDKNNSSSTNIRLEINDQTAFGNIFLSDTLNTGIYQIVCYTNCMRNYSEDSYFKKEIVIANRFDKQFNLFPFSSNTIDVVNSPGQFPSAIKMNENLVVIPAKSIFAPGERISFSVGTGSLTDTSMSDISVSVSETDTNILRNPSIPEYFNTENISVDTRKSEQTQCVYSQENIGPVIEGKVISLLHHNNQFDSDNINKSDEGKTFTILVSAADSISNMQYTKTDSPGSFRVHLDPYYDGKNIFIRIREKVNADIEIDNKFSLTQPFMPSGKFNVSGINTNLVRSAEIVKIQKLYNKQIAIVSKKEFMPGTIVPGIYFNGYSTIFPSDFIELQDFVEISREILPALRVRKAGDRYVSGYANLQLPAHLNAEPAIFLDGVPIDDVNQILSFGTGQIKRIESLNAIRFFGEMSFSGILAVFTKNYEVNNIHFVTPTIKYQTLMSQPFTQPEPFQPVASSSHIPDFRQLLLWDPVIHIKNGEKQQVECIASDLQGKYLINIQGLTSKGTPVSGSAVIIVRAKSK